MSRHVGVGVESTYGTPVAPTEFTEAVSETLQQVREFENITTIRSNSTRVVNELSNRIEGDIVLTGNFQDIGYLLYSFIGDVDTAGAGPYNHTFPGSTGTAGRTGVSSTVEVRRDSDTRTWRYAGCKTTGFQIAASLGQSPQLTFSFVGKSEATGTAATASYPDFDPMLVTDMSISFDGGSTTVDATDISLNCAWPVDNPYAIGSAAFAKEPIDNDVLAVSGSATVLFEDGEMTEYGYFDGSTDVDVQIIISDGTHSLTVNMNKTRITAAPVNLSGRERLVGTFEWQSFFDTTATENIQIVLTNDDATIPT